jgi:hypothetical protein
MTAVISMRLFAAAALAGPAGGGVLENERPPSGAGVADAGAVGKEPDGVAFGVAGFHI